MKSAMKSEHNKNVELADQRSNVYGFLAGIYRRELLPVLLSQIRTPQFSGVLSDLGANLGDEFFSFRDEDIIEDLAVEYTRLFMGPGKHIPPYESIHHERNDGDWGRLWGASTVEVQKFIETAGLKYKDDFKELPDHICVELEFMQKVIQKERLAWEARVGDRALYCLKMEKMFIDDHLIKWVPWFCDKIISEAKLPFYREMAKITSNFIQFEKENIDAYISDASNRGEEATR
jgi:TorA maturation chaperone TorD